MLITCVAGQLKAEKARISTVRVNNSLISHITIHHMRGGDETCNREKIHIMMMMMMKYKTQSITKYSNN